MKSKHTSIVLAFFISFFVAACSTASTTLSTGTTSATNPSDAGIADSFTFPIPSNQVSFRLGYDQQNNNLEGQNGCYKDSSGNFVPLNQLWHAGEDWFPPSHAVPIQAVANGIVAYISPILYSYPGAVVIIKHTLPDMTQVFSMYGHLDRAALTVTHVGQQVTKGQIIANNLLVQSYGGQDNTHLHWEIRYFEDGSGIARGTTSSSCSGEPVLVIPGLVIQMHLSFVA